MIKSRIIPSLLIKNNRCVKGVNFSNHIDVGNPISSAKIYEAQGADELMIINILPTNFNAQFIDTIKTMSYECYMPLTVGGGIKTIENMKNLFRNGADRIILNQTAINNPKIIESSSIEFGSQAIVISIDYSYGKDMKPYVIDRSADQKKLDPIEWAIYCEKMGAGEIIFTCVDNEGQKKGMDLEFIRKLSTMVNLPIVPSGGVGKLSDIFEVLNIDKINAVGIGSILNFSDQSVIKIHSYLHQKGVNVRNI
ncbi:MAG: imidazole glycerol phosphate synthase subunit HisF [Chloroflexi bacterium]|nr:imidazole glycerol phosphate synthase subunit HisF [Chloroflexota bacterium]|tara:strand:- start:741 stop:1496 length:756 start_codon:yes stop_codon:yes gene_type:complete